MKEYESRKDTKIDMDKDIKKLLAKCKSRTDYFILSQPEKMTPFHQIEAIDSQIEILANNIIHHLRR